MARAVAVAPPTVVLATSTAPQCVIGWPTRIAAILFRLAAGELRALRTKPEALADMARSAESSEPLVEVMMMNSSI
jgi:hypothetical protein